MTVPPILKSVDVERVLPDLRPLLAAVYTEVQQPVADVVALRRALEALLLYLSSPAGRTHANCVAADSFFLETDRWERTWGHLPDPYQDLLGDLGGALHDTLSAPEIAENFFSTPEQLLGQLRQIEIASPPT